MELIRRCRKKRGKRRFRKSIVARKMCMKIAEFMGRTISIFVTAIRRRQCGMFKKVLGRLFKIRKRTRIYTLSSTLSQTVTNCHSSRLIISTMRNFISTIAKTAVSYVHQLRTLPDFT